MSVVMLAKVSSLMAEKKWEEALQLTMTQEVFKTMAVEACGRFLDKRRTYARVLGPRPDTIKYVPASVVVIGDSQTRHAPRRTLGTYSKTLLDPSSSWDKQLTSPRFPNVRSLFVCCGFDILISDPNSDPSQPVLSVLRKLSQTYKSCPSTCRPAPNSFCQIHVFFLGLHLFL
jgi:hypothetical protein